MDNTSLPPLEFSANTHIKINLQNIEEKTKEFINSMVGSFETQIKKYKQRVVEDFTNFKENNEYNPIVPNFKKYNGYKLFVSQKYNKIKKLIPDEGNLYRSVTEKTEPNDIFSEIINILQKQNQNFVPIVGNYGSGKSLLSLNILYTLCNEELDNKDVIPLYIPLGSLDYKDDITHNDIIQNLFYNIFNYIKKQYNIVDEKFIKFSNSGKIIFILDAFDELSPTIEEKRILANLTQIENLARRGNKVILTSRYTYLSKDIEKKFIEGYDFYQIEDFDITLIKQFLERNHNYYKDGNKKAKILKFIEKDEFKDLAKKPLFLQIIYNNYEKIQKETIVNPATIFKSLTDEWINFDIEKKTISDKKKKELKDHRQRISEVLAIYANQNNNAAISKNDIKRYVKEEFSSAPLDVFRQLDTYYSDARNSTFLIKQHNEENEDTFSFLHQSIIEYFVARRIVTIINNKDDKELLLKYCHQIITAETFAFIHYIIEIEWGIQSHISNDLLSQINNEQTIHYIKSRTNKIDFIYEVLEYAKQKSIKKSSENPDIGNLITILYSISDFAKFNFKKETNRNYSENNFSNCNLTKTNLSYANLIGINLEGAYLSEANLEGANLRGANLQGASIYGANLSRANLEGANLRGANLQGASIYGADLQGADLSDAHLSGSGTNLFHANLSGANLQHANLFHANLSGTDLSSANLSGTDLSSANLPYSDLSGANLTHANLSGANLQHANLSDTDTNLSSAKPLWC